MNPRLDQRQLYGFALRYVRGSDLARRYPATANGRFRTREEAEAVRAACPNAEHIEVVDTREMA